MPNVFDHVWTDPGPVSFSMNICRPTCMSQNLPGDQNLIHALNYVALTLNYLTVSGIFGWFVKSLHVRENGGVCTHP